MTEARFPSCQSWHGLQSSGRKTGRSWGQDIQTPQSKMCWNWFVKAPMHPQLESIYSNALLYETTSVERNPLKFNSYQCGIKNASQDSHQGSSILLQSRAMFSSISRQVSVAVWMTINLLNGWWNVQLHTCSKGFLQSTSDLEEAEKENCNKQ